MMDKNLIILWLLLEYKGIIITLGTSGTMVTIIIYHNYKTSMVLPFNVTTTGSLDWPSILHITECTLKVQLVPPTESNKSPQVIFVALVVLGQEPQLEEMPYETAVQFGIMKYQLNESSLRRISKTPTIVGGE